MTDFVTVGGLLLPRLAPRITGWAALTALVFAVVAFVQGLRAPVVREYEVAMPGLPKERDGMVVVQISDLHLGTQIGRGWLERLVAQVESLQPDLLVVVGDVIDGNVSRVAPLVPVLKKFKAPLGVWAVTGNHEFYAGLEPAVALLESARFRMLRGASAEVAIAPGTPVTYNDPALMERMIPTLKRVAGNKGVKMAPAATTSEVARWPGSSLRLTVLLKPVPLMRISSVS